MKLMHGPVIDVYKSGNFWGCYLVARTGRKNVNLISLEDGNRFRDEDYQGDLSLFDNKALQEYLGDFYSFKLLFHLRELHVEGIRR